MVRLKVNETKPWEIIQVTECPQRIVECSVTGNVICVIDNDHSIGILFWDICMCRTSMNVVIDFYATFLEILCN